jgi:hypothetical protein
MSIAIRDGHWAAIPERLGGLGAALGDCGSWPAATSFPLLDAVEEPATPDLAGLASVFGAEDAWPSATFLPDLRD